MSNALNLDKKQILDMKFKGLNPFDAKHVKMYLENNGKVKASSNDILERAKILIGEENIKKNIGHARENTFGDVIPTSFNNETDVRSQLKNDMEGYVRSTGGLNMNLLTEQAETPNKVQPKNVKEIYELGYQNTIDYLNAFIVNIKTPSSSNRIKLFKSLQNCLQKEQSYKSNPNVLKAYQNGCLKAETEMYEKLKK